MHHREFSCSLVCCITVIHIQPYPYTCGNIVNTIKTNEKYTSLTLFEMVAKGLRKGNVWEVSRRLNKDCNILTPSSSVFSNTSFSFFCAAQPGSWGPPSAGNWFPLPRTATNWLQLTEFPVALGYIIVCRSPASCERRICTQFNPSTVKVILWYLRPDTPVPWSTAGSEVNMLQVH